MGLRNKWDSYKLYDDVSIFKKTFSIDLGKGQTITERVCPMTIMVDTWDNWGEPSTITADVWGLRILVAVSATPTGGDATVLRLEPNTNAATLNSVFDVPVGGGGDLNYLFTLNPTGISAWSTDGTPTIGSGGWLKIKVGTEDKWIQLYAVAP